MAGETAALNVRFTGESAGLVSETRSAERAMDRYGNEITRTTVKTAAFGKANQTATKTLAALRTGTTAMASAATLAAAAVGAVTAALVKNGLQSVDVLAKQSSELSIATESLAVYNRAAEVTGVKQELVGKSIQKMSRSLLEATQGSKIYADAFRALGINTREMIDLAPDVAFEKLADKIASVENPTLKSALAMQLLGRSGAEMINFLNLGAAGFAELRKEAEVAGVLISKDMAKQVEIANDAMGSLSLLTTGLSQQLAVKFAPALKAVADQLFLAAEEAGGMGVVAGKVFESIINGAKFVVNAISGFVRVTKLAGIGFQFLGQAFAKAIDFQFRVLQATPPGIAVRTFMAAFGFFSGEGWDFPDYNDSALHKSLTEFETDIKSMAAEVEGLLLDPLAGDKFVGYIDEARKQIELATSATEDLGTEVITTDEVMDALGDTSEKTAKKIKAGMDEATQSANFLMQILGSFSSGGLGGVGATLTSQLFSAGGGAFLKGTTSAGTSAGGSGGLLGLLAGGLSGVGSLTNSGLLGLSRVGSALGIPAGSGILGRFASNNAAFGSSLGFSGNSALGAGALASAGGGLLGGYAGHGLGSALFGNEAESSIGATAGGIVGSIWGPIGSFAGAALGGLIDSAFGTDFKGQRVIAGVDVGTNGNAIDGYDKSTIGASGLSFNQITRRADSNGAREFVESMVNGFITLDEALTSVAESAGLSIDLTGQTLQNPNQRTGSQPGSFFGSFAKGEVLADQLENAPADFVKAWLAEVNAELPKRVREILKGVDGTAEELVNAFNAALSIDKLLDLDVVRETADAMEALNEANKNMLDQYTDATEALLDLSDSYDGSATSLIDLNAALSDQKYLALQLAVAYQDVGAQVDSVLGNTIQSIRESVLTDEELYGLRRQQIQELTSDLATAVSPDEIASIVAQINQLSNSAYGLLDEGQQSTLANEFITFLSTANQLANDRINSGLGGLSELEAQVQTSIDYQLARDAATTQMAAATTFAEAVAQFAASVGNGSGFTFDYSGINVGIGEINA